MDRRKLLGLGLAALVSVATPAFAESYSDNVVSQLKRRGFKRITVGRTLLGRTRIVATGNGGRREIILNPRTGEILRDLWTANGSGSESDSSGGLISNSGSGNNNTDGDDDKDDDKDTGDDDSSGQGRGRGRGGDSDNSGSGSANRDDSDNDDD